MLKKNGRSSVSKHRADESRLLSLEKKRLKEMVEEEQRTLAGAAAGSAKKEKEVDEARRLSIEKHRPKEMLDEEQRRLASVSAAPTSSEAPLAAKGSEKPDDSKKLHNLSMQMNNLFDDDGDESRSKVDAAALLKEKEEALMKGQEQEREREKERAREKERERAREAALQRDRDAAMREEEERQRRDNEDRERKDRERREREEQAERDRKEGEARARREEEEAQRHKDKEREEQLRKEEELRKSRPKPLTSKGDPLSFVPHKVALSSIPKMQSPTILLQFPGKGGFTDSGALRPQVKVFQLSSDGKSIVAGPPTSKTGRDMKTICALEEVVKVIYGKSIHVAAALPGTLYKQSCCFSIVYFSEGLKAVHLQGSNSRVAMDWVLGLTAQVEKIQRPLGKGSFMLTCSKPISYGSFLWKQCHARIKEASMARKTLVSDALFKAVSGVPVTLDPLVI